MAWWIDNSQPSLPCATKVFSATGFTPGNSAGPFPTRAAALSACQKGTAPPAPGKPPRGKAKASIAADALQYAGAGYVFGGPADRPGDWDCSSFVSYVLGHDLGLLLPGGGRYGDPGYPPNTHGPVVLSYASWAGAVPVASPQAGDLCLWPGVGANAHMGIAIGPTRMISALNPQLGTMVTDIQGAGPSGVRVVFRRVTGAPGGVLRLPGGVTVSGPPSQRDPAVAVLVTAGLFALAFAGLAVAGAVVVLAGGWLMRKALA